MKGDKANIRVEPTNDAPTTGTILNDDAQVAKNESPRSTKRSFIRRNKKALGIAALLLAAGGVIAGIYIATTNGGVWKSKNNSTSNNATSHAAPSATKKAPATTCTDNETVAAGYMLYRNATYKYCIQHPTGWPVDQTDPARVILGTPTPEPAPGFLFVLYFSGKDISTRTSEIQADYAGIGGPCADSAVTIGGQPGKKLDCPTDSEGGNHIYYLVGASTNLFELNYIEGEGADQAPYDVIYNVMVGSFLTD